MLTSIHEFEKRYKAFEARTLDEAVEYASRAHGYAAAGPSKVERGATIFSSSLASVDELDFVTRRSNIGLEGTAGAGQDQFCICLPVKNLMGIVDPLFGEISARSHQARIYRKRPGTVVSTPSDDAFVFAMLLPADLLEMRARSFYGDELGQPLQFNPDIDLERPSGRMIASLLDHMQVLLTRIPESLSNPLARAAIKDHVISSILANLPNNYSGKLPIRDDGVIPRTVKRAEEYMRAHASEPLTLETLAREAGCSERALQNAFRSFRGTTPMGALRDIRLDYARLDLQKRANTVTEIALRWGFSNLGRFAALYAARHRETPSETLRLIVFPGGATICSEEPDTGWVDQGQGSLI